MTLPDPDFSAVAASLGYAYQFRFALNSAIELLRRGETNWSVSVETADDVVLETAEAIDYEQLKHRKSGTTLTLNSVDLWKTLRVWSVAIKANKVDLDRTHFFLVTTSKVVDADLAPLMLGNEPERDNSRIEAVLSATANSSGNAETEASRKAFLALQSAQRVELISKIQLRTSESDITNLGLRLRETAVLAAGHANADAFLDNLEGWWFRRCVTSLDGSGSRTIDGVDVDRCMTELRSKFNYSQLAINEDIAELEAVLDDFAKRTFVRQLDLIEVSGDRVLNAVSDYFRAFTQRTAWLDDGSLQMGDISSYERRLREEWNIRFHRMKDELGSEAATEEQRKEAARLYRWAAEECDIRVRPECAEGFIVRGSLHMLADEKRIGWHPDFESQLQLVLEGEIAHD